MFTADAYKMAKPQSGVVKYYNKQQLKRLRQKTGKFHWEHSIV